MLTSHLVLNVKEAAQSHSGDSEGQAPATRQDMRFARNTTLGTLGVSLSVPGELDDVALAVEKGPAEKADETTNAQGDGCV